MGWLLSMTGLRSPTSASFLRKRRFTLCSFATPTITFYRRLMKSKAPEQGRHGKMNNAQINAITFQRFDTTGEWTFTDGVKDNIVRMPALSKIFRAKIFGKLDGHCPHQSGGSIDEYLSTVLDIFFRRKCKATFPPKGKTAASSKVKLAGLSAISPSVRHENSALVPKLLPVQKPVHPL